MDAHLKTLAAAGLALDAADEAIGEGAFRGARDHLDAAATALSDLREAWPAMTAPERIVVGRIAPPLRARLDTLAARIQKQRTLSEGPAELDPEQDQEPEAA